MAKNSKRGGNHGRGFGFGSPPFRGRGRGQGARGSGYGPPSGGYHHSSQEPKEPGLSFLREDMNLITRMYDDAVSPPSQDQALGIRSGYSTPRGGQGGGRRRGRGRGRGSVGFDIPPNGNTGHGRYSSPQGTNTPSGRGRGRERGSPGPRHDFPNFSPKHGRGLGAPASSISAKNIGPNSTLSDLLFASRPLLRPIKFVRSEYNPFLFQINQEEIFQPVVEETRQDETSHVPTADRVEQIFHGNVGPFQEDDSSSSSSSEGEEEIEEIDFNSLDQLLTTPKRDRGTTSSKRKAKVNHVLQMVEDQVTTGFYQQPREEGLPPRPQEILTSIKPEVTQTVREVGEKSTTISEQADNQLFFIDTKPAYVPSNQETLKPTTLSDDEEIIVYVAPHPKVHSQSSSHRPPNQDASFTLLTTQSHDTSAYQPYNPPPTLSLASMSINDLQPSIEAEKDDEVPISSGVTYDPPLAEPASEAPNTPLHIPATSSLKFNFSSTFNKAAGSLSFSGRQLPEIIPPRVAKKQKAWERKKTKRQRKKEKKGRRGSLAAYGALLNDARLYDGEDLLVNGIGRDPRWQERRRSDSDVDWGTEESDGEMIEEDDVFLGGMSEKARGKQKARTQAEGIEADHGMDVDLEMDVGAMKQFVSGLMGENADRFTSMDDVEDERKIKAEDEEGLGGVEGSSDDEDDDDENIDAILDLEEKLLIGEGAEDGYDMDSDKEESDEDDLDVSPRTGFQARLEKMRARARSKRPVDALPDDEDEDDDMLERNMTWTEEDDYDDHNDLELIEHIQDILDQNADILEGRDKKARNKLFRAVQNGDFADMLPARKSKDKYKDVPQALQKQWELDRQHKAERKRERELQKLLIATDPFTKKKGGKKGRKAMLRAARTDPEAINLGPNRIIDFTTLVQQIRRFIADLNGPKSMSLPPTNKETRRNVHELACVFKLKSISKGNGYARYTTLTKTSKTGVGTVNEQKVNKILRRAAESAARGDTFSEFEDGEDEKRRLRGKPKHRERDDGEGKKRTLGGIPKHREGDKVGGSAPKISEGNVGFKMLAAMGWSEGDRIGLSGGLEAPLIAIIKHSKLGLGATK